MCRRPSMGAMAMGRVTERLTRLGYWRGLGDGWATLETVQDLVASEAGMGAFAPPGDRRLDDDRNGGVFAVRPIERSDDGLRRRTHRHSEHRSLLHRSRNNRSDTGG